MGTKTGLGHWYKAGRRRVPLRWVFVRDRTGTRRDEYVFTTDPARTPTEMIGHYCGRWNIGTAFQECRPGLGPESARGWRRATVVRAAPRLFGLHSVVAALYHSLPEGTRVGRVDWPGQVGVTCSDALTTVRRRLGDGGVFSQALDEGG